MLTAFWANFGGAIRSVIPAGPLRSLCSTCSSSIFLHLFLSKVTTFQNLQLTWCAEGSLCFTSSLTIHLENQLCIFSWNSSLQLCQYCNGTCNPVDMPSWVIIACWRPVPLQEGEPCIQHQLPSSQEIAPLSCFCWQSSTSPVWMCLMTRTDQSL